MPVTQKMIDETLASVKRMQGFDVDGLPRTGELGSQMEFSAVVEPAQKLVALHKKVNLLSIPAMSESMLGVVRKAADKDFNLFSSILAFTADQGGPQRDALTQQVIDAYEPTFNSLVNPICFGFSEATDFKALEDNARAALQGIEDRAAKQTEELQGAQKEAQQMLAEVKKTAAEQGVSQQAVHFQQEAIFHKNSQTTWLVAAGIFALLAAAWILVGTLPSEEWGVAVANYAATKTLGFSLLAFAVVFCVKNYMAHRHNYVVNTHRQKALQTYRTLADAAHSDNEQDIVLEQAARCIFSPQNTGYIKTGNDAGGHNILAMETVRRAAPKLPDNE